MAFGAAAVLQGVVTRDEPTAATGLDAGLLVRLLRRPLFLVAVLLNLVGFSLHVTALQSLPLFLVQTVIASEVAVTAVLSVRVFGTRLRRPQWYGVGAVVVGLALLASSATSDTVTGEHPRAPLVLLAVVLAAAALSVPAGRLPATVGALTLGLLGGVCFGVVALSARLLPSLAPGKLLTEGGAYVLVLAGAIAFLLYSTGMQRGSVTTTTAALVITQTGVPALVGVLLLGDRVRAGLAPVAVVGFVLALGGALALARAEAASPAEQHS